MMNGWKIQELRAAVLHDIRDFIPKDFYSNARTDDWIALKDSLLANQLILEQHRTPKFTPRQLTAVWLLDRIGLYCHKYESPDPAADAADGITPENIKEMCLKHLHDAFIRYAAHLDADEAKALMPADAPAENVKAERITIATQQNNAILNWLKANQHDPLKLPVPPRGLSGVKKLCRDELCGRKKQLFSSPSVFNTAWERLRSNDAIKDEE